MKRSKITIDYDEEADVLYLSFGDPVKAVTEEMGDIGIRINENTSEIVGVTIINFLKNLKKKNEPIELSV